MLLRELLGRPLDRAEQKRGRGRRRRWRGCTTTNFAAAHGRRGVRRAGAAAPRICCRAVPRAPNDAATGRGREGGAPSRVRSTFHAKLRVAWRRRILAKLSLRTGPSYLGPCALGTAPVLAPTAAPAERPSVTVGRLRPAGLSDAGRGDARRGAWNSSALRGANLSSDFRRPSASPWRAALSQPGSCRRRPRAVAAGWVEDSVFRLEDEERAAYAPPDVAAESAKEKARRRSEKTRRRALRRMQARRTGVAAPSLSPSSSGGSSTEPPPPSGLQLPDAVFARQ